LTSLFCLAIVSDVVVFIEVAAAAAAADVAAADVAAVVVVVGESMFSILEYKRTYSIDHVHIENYSSTLFLN